jgi:hypothetical protein
VESHADEGVSPFQAWTTVIDRRKDLNERGGCEMHRHVSRSLHSPMRLCKMENRDRDSPKNLGVYKILNLLFRPVDVVRETMVCLNFHLFLLSTTIHYKSEVTRNVVFVARPTRSTSEVALGSNSR